MSEQEKIDELLDLSHTIARRQRVNTALCVIVLLIVITACCFAGYKLTQITAQFQESITDLNTIKEEVNSFFDSSRPQAMKHRSRPSRTFTISPSRSTGFLRTLRRTGFWVSEALAVFPGSVTSVKTRFPVSKKVRMC